MQVAEKEICKRLLAEVPSDSTLRLQTLAVLSFVSTLPMIFICYASSIILLFIYPINMFFLAYLVYIYLDDSPYTGNCSSNWFRSLRSVS